MRVSTRVLLCLASSILAGAIYAQQSNPAVEQSRLYPRTLPPNTDNVTPDGIALPAGGASASTDEDLGAQQILKIKEEVSDLFATADASLFFTSNVALTRADMVSDGFFVGNAALNWVPRINSQLQFQLGGNASIFRYFDTSALDFENLSVGTGLTWTPPNFWGLAVVGRYDLIELLDRHGSEILQDNEFSLAVQKFISLGRSHGLTFGILGSVGISDPFAEQRDQAGFILGYHLQLTRRLGADFGYRHSWYFYNAGDRHDLNQVFSLGMRYNITPWASLNVFSSWATNYSNVSAFKYDVFSGGGGAALTVRF